MEITTENLIKRFKKKLKKGKNVFYFSYKDTQSLLIGLSQNIDLTTLLINTRNNGFSTFSGHINNKPINNTSQITILLDLEYLELPEVHIFDEENSEELSDHLDDFIIIFCEFDSYSALFYVFNTPSSQIGKKGISINNKPLTDYHKKIFLNTLSEDQCQLIQGALYSEIINESED